MNVIDVILAYLTPEFIAKTSYFIDETDHATSKGLACTIPVILGGVINESSNPSTSSQIWDLIHHKDNNVNLLNNEIDLLVENSSLQNQDISTTFINLLFGNDQISLLNEISKFAGFNHTFSASKITTIAGSLVLAFLKKKATTEAYGVSGLTTWLGGYKKEILEALPSGVSTGLLFNNLTSPVYKEPNLNQLKNVDEGGSNWWLWLIALIGLLGLLWSMMKGCNTTEMVDQVQSKIENKNSKLMDSSLLNLDSTVSPTNEMMNPLDSNVRIK